MRKLHTLDRGITRVEAALLVLLLSLMILLSFVQVILRNFFHTGIAWADPTLRHLVLWVGMIGASLATRQDKHIKIDVVTRFLSPTAKSGLQIILSLFSALISLWLFRASWQFVLDEQEGGSLFFGIIPLWPWQLILPLGFLLFSFRFLLRTVIDISQLMQKIQG